MTAIQKATAMTCLAGIHQTVGLFMKLCGPFLKCSALVHVGDLQRNLTRLIDNIESTEVTHD